MLGDQRQVFWVLLLIRGNVSSHCFRACFPFFLNSGLPSSSDLTCLVASWFLFQSILLIFIGFLSTPLLLFFLTNLFLPTVSVVLLFRYCFVTIALLFFSFFITSFVPLVVSFPLFFYDFLDYSLLSSLRRFTGYALLFYFTCFVCLAFFLFSSPVIA